MALRIAINGFGRIGRMCLRAILESKRSDLDVIAINDLHGVETNAHLLKFDSTHGPLGLDVSQIDGELIVSDKTVKYFSVDNPSKLPWADLDIDIVFECTGVFLSQDLAKGHLDAGAKKVLLSAPGVDPELTVVYGVNHDLITKEHKILSNASCTTNCLVTVVDILNKAVGIEKGYMTTVHSYTGDQQMLDNGHRDLRRARAANLSMVPTTTGAMKALEKVLPDMKGKLQGCAVRVPTPNVSLIDLTFTANRETSVEEVNQAMIDASNGLMKDIIGVFDLPLVSIDYNHNPNSASFDLSQTTVIDGDFVRVLAWYDNEWGFSNRMIDTALAMSRAGF